MIHTRGNRAVSLRFAPMLFALLLPLLAFAEEPADATRTYLLGPDDQISIRVAEAEEISDKPVRLDMSGVIRLPMVGRVKAGGLTTQQLETEIAGRLKEFIKDPDVSVSITEFRSQPVSVLGAVKTPGVHQLHGRKTLVEILSLAGGLLDEAGHSIKITRRLDQGPIPLATAKPDETGAFTVAEVGLKSIMAAQNPAENIVVKPHDVISIPRAELVYVIGNVTKSGGFVLKERENVSVLQALALAGGLDKAAAPQRSRILRASAGTSERTEIPVDIKQILTGKASDVPMQADDILFVPTNATKKAAIRALEAALQMGTGVVIYR